MLTNVLRAGSLSEAKRSPDVPGFRATGLDERRVGETSMRTAGSVEIQRPIEVVFRLTNDHVPEWSSVVLEDEVLEETPDRVGTTFRSVTEDRGRRMEFQGVVTLHDPPHASGVHLSGDMFDIDVFYSFERLADDRTRVAQRSEVTGKGLLRPFFLVCGWLLRKSSCNALDQELQGLKRFCESQPAGDGTPAPADRP